MCTVKPKSGDLSSLCVLGAIPILRRPTCHRCCIAKKNEWLLRRFAKNRGMASSKREPCHSYQKSSAPFCLFHRERNKLTPACGRGWSLVVTDLSTLRFTNRTEEKFNHCIFPVDIQQDKIFSIRCLSLPSRIVAADWPTWGKTVVVTFEESSIAFV